MGLELGARSYGVRVLALTPVNRGNPTSSPIRRGDVTMLITVCVRALRHCRCTGGRAPGAQVQWREGDVALRGHQGALMGSPPETPSPTMTATLQAVESP